jgi:hypothetical protein
MTEETPETKEESKQEAPKVTVRDVVVSQLNSLTSLPIRCVNIIYIPETGELMLNHTQGMPRHEIVGLMEAVRDETKK